MRKTIYISSDFEKVQEIAQAKGKNFSRYVCELVMKDLNESDSTSILLDEIRFIKESIINGHYVSQPVKQTPTAPVNKEKKRVKKLAKNITSF